MKFNLKNFPNKKDYVKESRFGKYIDFWSYSFKILEWKEGFTKEQNSDIVRLFCHRAGSIFSKEFEAGMLYAKLQTLGIEYPLKSRKDVEALVFLIGSFRMEKAKKKIKKILGETQ